MKDVVPWPTYGPQGQMLEFFDVGSSRVVTDTFRKEGISFYIQNIMGDGIKAKPGAEKAEFGA